MESELVSGFMTEHAAVIFVFFFLAEYASIVLICILTTILFLGGYLLDYTLLSSMLYYLLLIGDNALDIVYNVLSGNFSFSIGDSEYITESFEDILNSIVTFVSNPLIEGMIYGLTIGIKSCVMIFVFIWVRASFPRIRFDQLMSFSWTILLPIVIAFIVLVPCVMFGFDIIPSNISLL